MVKLTPIVSTVSVVYSRGVRISINERGISGVRLSLTSNARCPLHDFDDLWVANTYIERFVCT